MARQTGVATRVLVSANVSADITGPSRERLWETVSTPFISGRSYAGARITPEQQIPMWPRVRETSGEQKSSESSYKIFSKYPTVIFPVIEHTDRVGISTNSDDELHREVSWSEPARFDDAPGSGHAYLWRYVNCKRSNEKKNETQIRGANIDLVTKWNSSHCCIRPLQHARKHLSRRLLCACLTVVSRHPYAHYGYFHVK